MRRSDLAAWARMRLVLWPDAAEPELIREAEAYFDGASPLVAVFLAEAPSGEPMGMLELSLRLVAEGCRTTSVPYVEGWYIAGEARRHGVGCELMAAAEAWGRARGHTELASDALIGNIVSERAHLALGFAEVERAIHFRRTCSKPMAARMRPSGEKRLT